MPWSVDCKLGTHPTRHKEADLDWLRDSLFARRPYEVDKFTWDSVCHAFDSDTCRSADKLCCRARDGEGPAESWDSGSEREADRREDGAGTRDDSGRTRS